MVAIDALRPLAAIQGANKLLHGWSKGPWLLPYSRIFSSRSHKKSTQIEKWMQVVDPAELKSVAGQPLLSVSRDGSYALSLWLGLLDDADTWTKPTLYPRQELILIKVFSLSSPLFPWSKQMQLDMLIGTCQTLALGPGVATKSHGGCTAWGRRGAKVRANLVQFSQELFQTALGQTRSTVGGGGSTAVALRMADGSSHLHARREMENTQV